MTKYDIKIGTIEFKVQVENGAGTIESNLLIQKGDEDYNAEYRDTWNISIDAIESLILSHACAGVNILSQEYLHGLEHMLEKLTNEIA
jgi:hypothetical protein